MRFTFLYESWNFVSLDQHAPEVLGDAEALQAWPSMGNSLEVVLCGMVEGRPDSCRTDQTTHLMFILPLLFTRTLFPVVFLHRDHCMAHGASRPSLASVGWSW